MTKSANDRNTTETVIDAFSWKLLLFLWHTFCTSHSAVDIEFPVGMNKKGHTKIGGAWKHATKYPMVDKAPPMKYPIPEIEVAQMRMIVAFATVDVNNKRTRPQNQGY